MRFSLIDAKEAFLPVRRACQLLKVSVSGYYAWRNRAPCRRQQDDMIYLAHIRNLFTLSNSTYGSPRMTIEMQEQGFTIGRRRVARLMRENNFVARQKRRFKRTTTSNHANPVHPNLLD